MGIMNRKPLFKKFMQVSNISEKTLLINYDQLCNLNGFEFYSWEKYFEKGFGLMIGYKKIGRAHV